MSLMDYTSPFFGDRDMGQYSPPTMDTNVFINKNRLEKRLVNDNGQVYSADIFINTTSITPTGSISLQKQDIAWQGTLEGQNDRPACLLAIPAFFGNMAATLPNQIYQYYAPVINEFHDMPCYHYFLVSKNNGASFTFSYSNGNGNQGRYNVIDAARYKNPNNLVLSELDIYIQNQKSWLGQAESYTPTQYINNLGSWLNTVNANVKVNSLYTDYEVYDPSTIFTLTAANTVWSAKPGSVINNVRFLALSGSVLENAQRANYIGSFIASGLPIFTVKSYEQMIRYFEGESWIADNDELPPDDWSTDWNIYIKGAQRPDIFITMQSPKVEEWLDSDNNLSGIQKKDIKVEYRYTQYKRGSYLNPAEPPQYETVGTIIDWVKDNYNDDRETSYVDNIELNYPRLTVEGGFGEFDSGTIDGYFPFYAQLQFRVHYGKYRSTWCRYRIGVIGSPSVPDFSKMQNEGLQDDDWQDESSVTLHYDEYPPGYDPYPTPPLPDMPEIPDISGGGTKPSPSENGIGMLTTTYKVTQAQTEALGRFFWGGSLFEKIKALNTSPIENVVGLTIMPISISGNDEVITIGDVDTNINGEKISNVPLYTVGSAEIKGRYQSFLDFEPYTTMHLFLPFVGFVRIDPMYVTNKTLEVIYSFDIINGLCNAMIFCDNIYVESHQGHCGIDIPLIATNRADLAIGLATSLFDTAVSGGDMTTIAGSALKAAGDYITGFHSSRQGGYSPTCAWTETRNCFLVIETPNASHTSTYNHDKGRPCDTSYTIGTLSGFTVCDANIDLSGISGATEEEKNMIRDILTSGFFA